MENIALPRKMLYKAIKYMGALRAKRPYTLQDLGWRECTRILSEQ